MNQNFHEILIDTNFWSRLEMKATQWLVDTKDPEYRNLWIDGFLPNHSKHLKNRIEIIGTVWIAKGGREQLPLDFVARLSTTIAQAPAKEFAIDSISFEKNRLVISVG